MVGRAVVSSDRPGPRPRPSRRGARGRPRPSRRPRRRRPGGRRPPSPRWPAPPPGRRPPAGAGRPPASPASSRSSADAVGLVVDHHQSVVPAVEQVDVALEDGVAEGHPHVDLAPVGERRGLDHRRRGEGRAGQGGDALLLALDALGRGLGCGQRLDAVAGGQVDDLEHRVDGPADGGAVPTLAPGRQVEVDAPLGQAGLGVVRGGGAGQLLEAVVVLAGAVGPAPGPGQRQRGQSGGRERAREPGGGDQALTLRPPRREVGDGRLGLRPRRAGRLRWRGDGEGWRDLLHAGQLGQRPPVR